MENKVEKKKPENELVPPGTNLQDCGCDSGYIVEKYFATGGMHNDIYTCHHESQPSKTLLAKIIYKKNAGMEEKEWNRVRVEVINSLRVKNKPYLIQTHCVLRSCDDDPDPYFIIIMDKFEGITLREYLYDYGCLVPAKAISIFKKVLIGIQSLHNFTHQIIHRDLKPENIMISRDLSNIAIIDFGIATVVNKKAIIDDGSGKFEVLSDESQLLGTLEYVIPDVRSSYKKGQSGYATVQADFYSLGVILYEMIMGDKPFKYVAYKDEKDNGKNLQIPLRYDMLNISANPSIPVALENIIFRCIACKPDDIKFRYTKIEQIIEDIDKVKHSLNKNDDNTQLLKPVYKRIYQQSDHFNITKIKGGQKWYKQWWFLILVSLLALTILILCIVGFFVL